ncbi:MAG: hypothetical protein WCA31_07330 [Acidimicrobiales bacterium]
MKIVTLCTGNVARSVMLGYMLTTLAEANGQQWSIRTTGTHVIEGSAMSARTRDALMKLEDLGVHHFSGHRSRQLNDEDVAWGDVILASEAANVHFVRAHHPDGAPKAVILQQFVREAPLDLPLEEQVRYVASLEPLAYFDVEDPAGKDQAAYDACAANLWEMAQVFATLVTEEL